MRRKIESNPRLSVDKTNSVYYNEKSAVAYSFKI